MRCYFSKNKVNMLPGTETGSVFYNCPVCGIVYLTEEAAELHQGQISDEQKHIISIVLRNNYENRGRKRSKKPLTLDELFQIAKTPLLDPIEKMDNALLILEKESKYVGQPVSVDITNDFPLYHCFEPKELHPLLMLLLQEGYIEAKDHYNPHNECYLNAKGYQRLREIKKPSD